jgi:hypothetical protein
MSRWIVFDQETFKRVRRQLPRENLFEHGARNAVEYATDRQETMVAVLALGSRKEAGVAIFRPSLGNQFAAAVGPQLAKAKQPGREGADSELRRAQEAQVRAGGLLGLRDEAYYEEQPKPPRKQSWWRRFWPEED